MFDLKKKQEDLEKINNELKIYVNEKSKNETDTVTFENCVESKNVIAKNVTAKNCVAISDNLLIKEIINNYIYYKFCYISIGFTRKWVSFKLELLPSRAIYDIRIDDQVYAAGKIDSNILSCIRELVKDIQ